MTTSSSQEVGDATGGLGDNFYELSIQETFELYDELRSCPVRRSDSLGGFYWLTRYEDVRAAAQDWETFSSGRKGIMLPPIESTLRGQALEMDPPEHGPWRRLFLDALTPERLREITPDLVATANGLIDRFAGVGKCDLYNDFAAPLPALGVCQAIGVSAASVDRIRESSDKFTSQSGDDTTDDRVAAMQAIGAIVLEELHARRDDPRDDYLTRVVQSELYGRPMNDEELGLFMAGFLVAGHETTTSAMVSLFYHVLPRPDLVQRMLSDDGVLVPRSRKRCGCIRRSSHFTAPPPRT